VTSQTLIAPLSPDDVVRRMEVVVRRGFRLSEFQLFDLERAIDGSGASDLYQGDLDRSGFRLVRRTFGRSLFRPLLVGSFEERNEGTRVDFRVIFDWKNVAALAAFGVLVPAVLMQLAGDPGIGLQRWLAAALSATWVGVVAVLTEFSRRNAAGRLRRRLENLLCNGGVRPAGDVPVVSARAGGGD